MYTRNVSVISQDVIKFLTICVEYCNFITISLFGLDMKLMYCSCLSKYPSKVYCYSRFCLEYGGPDVHKENVIWNHMSFSRVYFRMIFSPGVCFRYNLCIVIGLGCFPESADRVIYRRILVPHAFWNRSSQTYNGMHVYLNPDRNSTEYFSTKWKRWIHMRNFPFLLLHLLAGFCLMSESHGHLLASKEILYW